MKTIVSKLPDETKLVVLSSYAHYAIELEGETLKLLEYPEDCPEMNQRDSFSDSDKEEVLSWHKDEKILFTSFLSNRIIAPHIPNKGICCGDDFIYSLTNMDYDWAMKESH